MMKEGGTMFGAMFGDIIGSCYEVRCTKKYDFPFPRESTFTDDSVLTAAVCRALLDDPSAINRFGVKKRALRYASYYRQFYSCFPEAGFGNMFRKWAVSGTSDFNRSYANGAAMRVAPIAYAYDSLHQVLLQTKASCLPTHDHREAINGAMAVASAVFIARTGGSKDDVRRYVEKKFYDLSTPLSAIRETHVFNSRSSYSVPPAIIAFLESEDYESAVRNAVSLGGDADTQACIAGAIAEAYYKKIPDSIKSFCYPRLDVTLRKAARDFYDKYGIEY